MKKIFTSLALAALTALPALAALPTFRTFSAAGNAASPATVYLPADPNSQIRVVSAFYQTDTNNAALIFTSGQGAYYQAQTNALSSSITNQVNTTNGLTAGSTLVLQQGGSCYAAVLSSLATSLSTNAYSVVTTNYFVVLASGGWAVSAVQYADIYQMGSATTLTVGNATNGINGDAIYVAAYGRPVAVKLSPALGTNQITALTVHYDSQSQ